MLTSFRRLPPVLLEEVEADVITGVSSTLASTDALKKLAATSPCSSTSAPEKTSQQCPPSVAHTTMPGSHRPYASSSISPLDALITYASCARPRVDIPPNVLLTSDASTVTIFDRYPKGGAPHLCDFHGSPSCAQPNTTFSCCRETHPTRRSHRTPFSPYRISSTGRRRPARRPLAATTPCRSSTLSPPPLKSAKR